MPVCIIHINMVQFQRNTAEFISGLLYAGYKLGEHFRNPLLISAPIEQRGILPPQE